MVLNERQRDILRIVQNMDISATMFKNAVEKYTALAEYLIRNGINADIYPQGSFALGTVVRPYSCDEEKNYDLDLVCQVKYNRNEITPARLRKQISDVLRRSEIYKSRLTEDETCFTIDYADIGDVSFSIDVVPAVNETAGRIQQLKRLSKKSELVEYSIAIPERPKGEVSDWITSNPKGYKQWFDGINDEFNILDRQELRRSLFEGNRAIYASVDDVPKDLERTSVQRVIQILKYHRNVYYEHMNKAEEKPASAIINTIVALCAESTDVNVTVFDLLNYVLVNIAACGELLKHNSGDSTASIIVKENGKWVLENPANADDNLADAWNENDEIPELFFKWVDSAKKQLVDSLGSSDEEFRENIEKSFGVSRVQAVLGNKYTSALLDPVSGTSSPKPWRVK